MELERKILIMCPSQKLTRQDDAEFVETVLDSSKTQTLSFSEEQFEKVASVLGKRTSEYGAWWVSYEEDWVEGQENLKGFLEVIASSMDANLDIETRDLLDQMGNLAKSAYQARVPLVIRT